MPTISQLDSNQVLPHVMDEPALALRVNVVASVPSTEAATAAPGAAQPAVDKVVGGVDGGNIVRTLKTNTSGELQVDIVSAALPSGAATEATLAAFSNKTAGALVSEDFDYQAITYVGVTTDIDTVVYKTGGAGGTTVATLTMGYDGSDRLTSVTKT